MIDTEDVFVWKIYRDRYADLAKRMAKVVKKSISKAEFETMLSKGGAYLNFEDACMHVTLRKPKELTKKERKYLKRCFNMSLADHVYMTMKNGSEGRIPKGQDLKTLLQAYGVKLDDKDNTGKKGGTPKLTVITK